MAATQSPVVKQIDKQFLVCGICLERYHTPKVLPCLHTFCQKCLQNYVPAESLTLSCPICRQQSILPIEGVTGLQNNFFITNLMEVLEGPDSSSGDEGASGGDQPYHVVPSCSSHEGEPLDYYCDDCETAVCGECTMSEHVDHPTVLLSDIIDEHKEVLRNILDKAKHQIPRLQDAIEQVTVINGSLEEKKTKAETEILTSFDTLERSIRNRKETLIKELKSTHESKQEVLHKQQEVLEQELLSIEHNCDFTEQALRSGNEMQILLVRKQMGQRLRELTEQCTQLQPQENDFISFIGCMGDMEKTLSNLGMVRSNSAVAHETVAVGEGLKRAFCGEQMVVTITTKNYRGELVTTGEAEVTAELHSGDGEVHDARVIDNKNGTYDVLYMIPREGSHQLSIKLFGRNIRGSPFKLRVMRESSSSSPKSPTSKIPRSNVKQRAMRRPQSAAGSLRVYRKTNPIEDDLVLIIGQRGRNKGEFTNPQGVASTAANGGRIVVADSNNQCVQVFTNGGDCKHKFGIRGRSNGQMQRPTGVAVTVIGNYVVADYDNKWINIFGPDGKFINKIGTGKLIGPKGVCVDSNNNIIVVDNKSSSILIFTSNGKLLNKFGSRGAEDQQLCGPHFVAVNNNNQIVVSDFHNHCIKVFEQDGQLVSMFGSRGEGNGQFNAPTGVAVDLIGNIIVADWGNSRIQVFDHTGSFLSYVNTTGDPLYGPQDLAVTSDGYVAVADSGNHCVKVYKYLQ
ncbi:tripartite motif-containing protein 2-like isoform X2 [Acanthaster planci]|uniref:Tripartite motif-containing protein 2-like isoform X2 n=1 Tax=Acanthaster planci TaxID=133434 RepID=A0A8B7XHW2_ACAPL|nr:tripartite motif-containing protein 2-like isoform X2 [Acanthaster planci]